MTSRWARLIRGQFVAVLSTFVAAFSHGFADGAHPPAVAVVLALAFSSMVCAFLATAKPSSARLPRVRLAASVAVSQAIYHGLFSVFGPAGVPPGSVVSGHHGTVVFTSGSAQQVAVASSDQWML